MTGRAAPAGQTDDPVAAAALGALAEQLRTAAAARRPLQIAGGGSKAFLNPARDETRLAMAAYAGILAYEPSELVIEARAGTRLDVVEQTLAAHGQMLACEPPRFGFASTLGGVVSAGLSGPARPYTGALRDHVLGVSVLDAEGRLLHFGGRVMKNVAGYDVSRLVTGAWGALGPIAGVALRVAPLPEAVVSVAWSLDAAAAVTRMTALARTAWPVNGACVDDGLLRVRLAGSRPAVEEAVHALRPDAVENELSYWQGLRDHRLPFFADPAPLWRLSLPPATPPLDLPGRTLIDWGGAQRWLKTDAPAALLHAAAGAAGGHAQPFFAAVDDEFAPLSAPQRALQMRIKAAFDPLGLFNAGSARAGV